MKAARYYGPGQIAIENLEEPRIQNGEVLVAMKACGICGTDIKTYVRGHPLISPGSVIGHEIAGVVIESQHPNFHNGERVVVGPYAPCLTCSRCQQGHYSLCENLWDAGPEPGGFAEVIRVPRRIADQVLLKMNDTVDFQTAALCEPLACCIHGLDAVGLSVGQSLLVIGDGPMGLLQAAVARQLGASPVILSGMTPNRLAFAEKVADVVVDVSKDDLAAALKQIVPAGPEKIMVSVASVDLALQAIALVAKGGAVNVFAGMPKDATLAIPAHRIHYDEVRVVGTFGFGPPDFRKALDVLQSGAMSLDGFFTGTATLDGLEDALKAASHYEGIKTVVVTEQA